MSGSKIKFYLCFCVLLSAGPLPLGATDGRPILDLGIVSWLEYQKKQLLVEITEVKIHDHAIEAANISVSIYQAVIFENQDDTNHRLVFLPDVDNLMESAYTSAVIRASERWGAEFHAFGVFPYQCTMHPEENGRITVTL
jgi:plastocyanin